MRTKNILCFFIAAAILLFNASAQQKTFASTFKLPSRVTAADYEKGKIIFKLKPEFRSSGINEHSLEKIFSSLKTKSIKKLFPNNQPPASERNADGQLLVDLSLIWQLNYDSDIPIEKAINMLMSTGKLIYAEPSYIYKPAYIPNDTSFAIQYHLAKIHAIQAWDITHGDSTIVIGITDTGFDTTHPELRPRIKYNTADPINGIDDDGDGFTDNYYGWNIAMNNNDVYGPLALHGTFVAGVACAQVDNIIDGAGVGFNTKFLPVRLSSNANTIINGELGIVYAADHNCIAVNCSWGGFGGSQFGQDAVNYATFNKNCLVVGAAGNNQDETPFYPAAYENVLSIAGSDTADNRWAGSSYGCTCDMSCPGDIIWSIAPASTIMIVSGGTSEAAPQATAAAALVKKQFPALNALQIGERLRVTSDNLDTVSGNGSYFHLLGKGRLNIFRAVTEPATSARASAISIADNNDNAFILGDTLRISAVFTNYLDPLSNLTVTLSSSSPYISLIDSVFNSSAMNSLEVDSNRSNPFRAVIVGTPPVNTEVYFTFNYSDGTYNDWQCMKVLINVDYINIFINEVGTSMTSKGRLGFNDAGQAQGIGFIYHQGPSLLYNGGTVIGVNDSMVSDVTIGSPATSTENDFVSILRVHQEIPSVVSDFDAITIFNDDSATYPLGISVTHRAHAWIAPGHAKYIIYDYVIHNNSATNYNSLYIGLYADWDIPPPNYATNVEGFDAPRRLCWAHDTQPGGVFAGIKVLTPGGINYYAFNNNGSNGSVSIYDGFTKQEKYQTMSSLSRLASDTTDISMMISSGPFSVAVGDSVHIAFALLAGDSLTQLQATADSAQQQFNSIGSGIHEYPVLADNFACFPNPATDFCTIQITLSTFSSVELNLYSVLGENVVNIFSGYQNAGSRQYNFDTSKLSSGIYLCELKTGEGQMIKKLVIH
jgi:serine protease